MSKSTTFKERAAIVGYHADAYTVTCRSCAWESTQLHTWDYFGLQSALREAREHGEQNRHQMGHGAMVGEACLCALPGQPALDLAVA